MCTRYVEIVFMVMSGMTSKQEANIKGGTFTESETCK